MRWLPLVLLSGCNLYVDGDAPPDGWLDPPAEAHCGQPLPTTAPPSITFRSTVIDQAGDPIAGARVELVTTATVASTQAGADGGYVLTVPTGGVPLDGHLHASAAGRVDMDYYPAAPFVEDSDDFGFLLQTPAFYDQLVASGGVTQDPTKGFVLAGVLDCDEAAIAGARLTLQGAPDATIRYVDYDDDGQTVFSDATSDQGTAMIYDVATTPVWIDGAAGTIELHGHRITAKEGAMTIVLMQP